MRPDDIEQDSPILTITVAAELAGMHAQTLRQYDRLGLVIPARSAGGSRRYSLRDVSQLREVARLSSDGMSLSAIARIVDLENHVRALQARVGELQRRLAEEVAQRPGSRVFAAGITGAVTPLRRGSRVRRATEVALYRPRRPAADVPDLDDEA